MAELRKIGTNLWSLPIHANQGKALGEPKGLTEGAALNTRPSISADGRKLVFLSNRSGNLDVWIKDMHRGKETALAASPLPKTHALITPDGSRVVYTVFENQKRSLNVVPAAGVSERLCDDCGLSHDWSPDGKKIVYSWGQPTHWSVIDAGTHERFEVLHHPKHNTHVVRFSPDGRWISFHVPLEAEAGRSTVYIAPLQPGGAPENEWIAVGDGSSIDSNACWSPDGNLLYFLSRRDGFQCIWTQRLVPGTKRPVGSPQEFYHFHGARRSIFTEGSPRITSDKLVFGMVESTGNIWMAKLE